MRAQMHGGPLDGQTIDIEDERIVRWVELQRDESAPPGPDGHKPLVGHAYERRRVQLVEGDEPPVHFDYIGRHN